MYTRIHHNPFNLNLSILDKMNKGLPVKPNVYKAAGFLLSSLAYYVPNQKLYVDYLNQQDFDINSCLMPAQISQKVLVLGLADSTCLGMSVASTLRSADYRAVTKDNIELSPHIKINDDNYLYATNDLDFSCYDDVVIVTNTLTDGNTAFQLMNTLYRECHVRNCRIFTLVNLLCEKEAQKFCELEKELGINIYLHALVAGCVSEKEDVIEGETPIHTFANTKSWGLPKFSRVFYKRNGRMIGYLKDGGRFGVQTSDFEFLETMTASIAEKINKRLGENKKILILGHDETTYIPSRVAARLKGDVSVAMTTMTQFPIADNVTSKKCFKDNDKLFYFYNAREIEEEYDFVVFLNETDLNVMLTKNMSILKL